MKAILMKPTQAPVARMAVKPSAKLSSRALTARPAFNVSIKTRQTSRPLVIVAAEPAGTTTGAGAVNDNTWEEIVLKSPVPVLVDYWAPWCGPCRMIAPLIDEIAAEYGERLRVVKLNTDESPSVATEYGIRSIPTVMVFKNGQKMDAVIGAVPKSTLIQTIEKYLA